MNLILSILRSALPAGVLVLASTFAHAQLTVEVSGAGSNRMPVAVAAFEGESALPRAITDVVRADLERSGLFKLVELGPAPMGADNPDLARARSRGADSLAVGTIAPAGGGRYQVTVRLLDTPKQLSLGSQAMTMAPNQYRTTGHRIADFIYEKLTGEPGVFSTRIAYVVKTGSRYALQIADADGQNAQSALVSKEPIISPAWSPDGGRLAYVSFENKKPVVYVHNLATGRRQVVSNFKGSNSAPAWSPDGTRLAVALTLSGNTQIYLVGADGGAPRRLTQSQGIDTEPAFTPDGSRILFTSDRAGGPQIYSMPASGGPATRLTYEGNYNVSPAVSPDGKSFAFVRREGGRYRVMVQQFGSSQANYVSDTQFDESPSFAPNGKMILFASEQGGRGVLYTVTADGLTKTRLGASGDVMEPDWGPMPR